MATDYRRTIQSWNGTAWVPATTGAYALRRDPYSTNLFVGSHVSNGSWSFGAVTSGDDYQLWYSGDSWATSAIVPSFGTFPVNAGVQAKSNQVEVSVSESEQAGILYGTLASAISAFVSPAITNQCLVNISGTGTTSQFITLAHASLVSYVHLRGASKHINLILGTATASIDKTMTLTDLRVYFSNLDITTARTYTNFTFENCDIYCYNDVDFTNCVLHNCRIFNTGVSCRLIGTTEMTNCIVSGTLTTDTFTGFVANVTDEVSASYTMPTDPLTP